MAATVSLRLLNNASTLEVAMGTTLMEVLQTIELDTPYPILAARGTFYHLFYCVFRSCRLYKAKGKSESERKDPLSILGR